METQTIQLLKRARECVPRQSNSALAKAIDADRSNLVRYLRGDGYPNGMHAIELARLLKMDTNEVLAIIAADKARSPEAKERARMKLPRISPAACVALACIAGALTSLGGSAKAQAEGVYGLDSFEPVYIIRSALKRLAALWRSCRWARTRKKEGFPKSDIGRFARLTTVSALC